MYFLIVFNRFIAKHLIECAVDNLNGMDPGARRLRSRISVGIMGYCPYFGWKKFSIVFI